MADDCTCTVLSRGLRLLLRMYHYGSAVTTTDAPPPSGSAPRVQGPEKAELGNCTTCRWHDLNHYRASPSWSHVAQTTSMLHSKSTQIKRADPQSWVVTPVSPIPGRARRKHCQMKLVSYVACCPPFQHRIIDGLLCSCVETVANVQAVGGGRWRDPE